MSSVLPNIYPANKRAPNVKRSGERLVRLAYDLEELTSRLRAAGYDSEADGVRSLSSQAGKLGRLIDERVRK